MLERHSGIGRWISFLSSTRHSYLLLKWLALSSSCLSHFLRHCKPHITTGVCIKTPHRRHKFHRFMQMPLQPERFVKPILLFLALGRPLDVTGTRSILLHTHVFPISYPAILFFQWLNSKPLLKHSGIYRCQCYDDLVVPSLLYAQWVPICRCWVWRCGSPYL